MTSVAPPSLLLQLLLLLQVLSLTSSLPLASPAGSD
jgi:hypothetical protein